MGWKVSGKLNSLRTDKIGDMSVVEFAQSFDRFNVLLGFGAVYGRVHLFRSFLVYQRLLLGRPHPPHHHRTLQTTANRPVGHTAVTLLWHWYGMV